MICSQNVPKSLYALCGCILCGLQLVLTVLAHFNHGYSGIQEGSSIHGGIWEWCDDDPDSLDFGCHSYSVHNNDTSSTTKTKIDVAESFLLVDHLLCVAEATIFIMCLFVANRTIALFNIVFAVLNTLCIIIACSVMTAAYKDFTDKDFELSWGTYLPWVGAILAFLALPFSCFISLFWSSIGEHLPGTGALDTDRSLANYSSWHSTD